METITKEEFLLEMTVIVPIRKIISKLEKKEYRDCDVPVLSKKLKGFTDLCLEFMENDKDGQEVGEISGLMNDYNKDRFITYFKTLLKFFERYV